METFEPKVEVRLSSLDLVRLQQVARTLDMSASEFAYEILLKAIARVEKVERQRVTQESTVASFSAAFSSAESHVAP